MPVNRRKDLPACRAGERVPGVEELRERFGYVKVIPSRTGGKKYLVVEASDGYHAFVEINGSYCSTGSYPSLESLEGYVY